MSNREQYIIVGASSTDSSSPEMLFPVSGGILTIEGMTSGNVLLESYETGSWVTLFTYTADQSVQPNVAPGTLVRISWDTVVGTPSISLLPASDNGFATAAADIVNIEADIASIEDSISGILFVDADNGDYTVAAGDEPFSVISVINGAANTVVSIIIDDTVGALIPTNLVIRNSGFGPARIYYASNIGGSIYVPAGQTDYVLNFAALAALLQTDRHRIIQSGVGLQDTAGSGVLTAATITVPARMMSATGSIRIKSIWRFSGATAARVIAATFGGTTYYSVSNLSSINNLVMTTEICNKNSTSVQVGGASNVSASGLGNSAGAVVTSAVDTTNDVTILLTANLNAADTFSLDHYTVEYLP
jgi:hypothetical protein